MVACESSPTQPDDPRVPPAVGTPTRLMLQPCAYETTVARCPLEAIWGDLYRSSRMVTTQSQWTSGAPGVVRVTAPGSLQAVAPGDADITMRFNGRELVETFRVFESGPPWRVSKGPSIEYLIRVQDDRATPLDGVLVEIIGGGNAGRQTISSNGGRASFPGDFVCGPITVRATKDGYQPWVRSTTNCVSAGNPYWSSESVSPVVMIPVA